MYLANYKESIGIKVELVKPDMQHIREQLDNFLKELQDKVDKKPLKIAFDKDIINGVINQLKDIEKLTEKLGADGLTESLKQAVKVTQDLNSEMKSSSKVNEEKYQAEAFALYDQYERKKEKRANEAYNKRMQEQQNLTTLFERNEILREQANKKNEKEEDELVQKYLKELEIQEQIEQQKKSDDAFDKWQRGNDFLVEEQRAMIQKEKVQDEITRQEDELVEKYLRELEIQEELAQQKKSDQAFAEWQRGNDYLIEEHRAKLIEEQKIEVELENEKIKTASDRERVLKEEQKIRRAIAKEQEKQNKSNEKDAYKEAEASLKREYDLKTKLVKADGEQATAIKQQLEQQQLLTNELREQLSVQNRTKLNKKEGTLQSNLAIAEKGGSKSLGSEVKDAFNQFAQWAIIYNGMQALFNQVRDGVTFVNDLNKSLTEIAIVTGRTQDETKKLAKDYNNLAKEMKVTTKEIADASVEFYRQGLSDQQVMERLQETTKYAKISNMDFNESAKVLTATVNSMGIGITKASDTFSYLGDQTATGADEIGRAFQKVGKNNCPYI